MKKQYTILTVVLAVAAILLYLSFTQQNTHEHLCAGINAEILAIDSDTKIIEVAYTNETEYTPAKATLDCNRAIALHQILHCDYKTGDVQVLTFDLLRVGDWVILTLEYDEFVQMRDIGHASVYQMQLATQRFR